MPDDSKLDLLRASVRPVIARSKLPTPELIRSTISEYRRLPMLAVDDDEAEQLAREIESQLDIQMTVGSVVQEDGFVEWYQAARAGFEPYYWDRYRLLLEEKAFAPAVVATLDQVTDRIAGLLENPEKPGPWDRRGMVVGHVQSGKTANYTGLICKAADAGYRLIVVIAGIHNNLRNQTQQRVDEGFVGRDSSKPNKPLMGVSRFSSKKVPITLTNATSDFNAGIANQAGIGIDSLRVPLVLVIKKNTGTLKNLLAWLKAHNTGIARTLVDAPMLLIDDEADNASINTAANPGEATRINELIRELLNLFRRKCYVGYTATPFANIFIDPDTDDAMRKEDLFPRDFIVTLDPPSNYFGADRIFQTDEGQRYLRPISDNSDFLPIVHKQTFDIPDLPESLCEAIRAFVLARAIRILRDQGRNHTSMLVNASRFTRVQKQLRNLVHDYLGRLERAIRMEGARPRAQALQNEHLKALHETWQREYATLGFGWDQAQAVLLEAIAPIRVEEVNSASSGRLDYAAHDTNGLQVIAVGGFSLSRGLTLEGLTISYFLRNSMMYDTLLQMGRWFGYRPGYEDLCRIWMPPEAQGWYEHISESVEELRDELRRMEAARLTPRDFGLRVRSHPDALIVTARNKMRSAEDVAVSISLAGHFIETYALDRSAAALASNRQAAMNLVSRLEKISPAPRGSNGNRLWQGVEFEAVVEFLEHFRNHPRSLQTEVRPVLEFIRAGSHAELARWDIAVVGRGGLAGPDGLVDSDLDVLCQQRSIGKDSTSDFILIGDRNRVSSRGVEAIGLDPAVRKAAEDAYAATLRKTDGVNFPDRIYRAPRTRPLLVIQPLELRQDDRRLLPAPAIAWSISFPADASFDHRTVSYMVNTRWWKDYVGEEAEDEDVTSEAA